jgi:hypothetical protein
MAKPSYARLQLKASIIFILIPLNVTSTLPTITVDNLKRTYIFAIVRTRDAC